MEHSTASLFRRQAYSVLRLVLRRACALFSPKRNFARKGCWASASCACSWIFLRNLIYLLQQRAHHAYRSRSSRNTITYIAVYVPVAGSNGASGRHPLSRHNQALSMFFREKSHDRYWRLGGIASPVLPTFPSSPPSRHNTPPAASCAGSAALL